MPRTISTSSIVFMVLTLVVLTFSACGKKAEQEGPRPQGAQQHEEPSSTPTPETSPTPPVAGGAEPTATPTPAPAPTPIPGEPTPLPSKPSEKPPASTVPVPKPTSTPPVSPPAQDGEMRRLQAAAVWSHVTGSRTWTEAVIKVVRQNISSFEKARDKEEFCPGYAGASKTQREMCWLRLIGGVVRFESNFNPRASFREKNGIYSVGLMMLSVGECPNAPTDEALKNAVRNLTCGTSMMARMIARAGFIEGPPSGRGAAAYWSVLRPPYTANGYNLGKRDKIIALSKRYKEF